MRTNREHVEEREVERANDQIDAGVRVCLPDLLGQVRDDGRDAGRSVAGDRATSPLTSDATDA